MHSKNKPRQTIAERQHASMLAEMPCAVCDAPGPSEVHEPRQGKWWLAMPLCEGCHRGPVNGIHGNKAIWNVQKVDEWDVLGRVIERLHRNRL